MWLLATIFIAFSLCSKDYCIWLQALLFWISSQLRIIRVSIFPHTVIFCTFKTIVNGILRNKTSPLLSLGCSSMALIYNQQGLFLNCSMVDLKYCLVSSAQQSGLVRYIYMCIDNCKALILIIWQWQQYLGCMAYPVKDILISELLKHVF